MNKYLKELRKYAFTPLLECTKNKSFFTQQEYESNRGKIMMINNAVDKLEKELKSKTN